MNALATSLFFFAFTQHGFAVNDALDVPLCDAVLSRKEIIRLQEIDRQLADEFRKTYPVSFESTLSIKVEKKIEESDPRGPRFIIRKLKDAEWPSTFGSKKFANQGDPRSFIFLAGPFVAKFFGYEMLGENAVIVPSAKRFKWAVDKLNSLNLKEKIDLGFFESTAIEETGEFLERFSENGEFPLSTRSGKSRSAHGAQAHDHAFHTPAVFFPSPVVQLARRQVSAVLGFFEYVKKAAPSFAADREIKLFIEKTLESMGIAVDFGTGNGSHAVHKFYADLSKHGWADFVEANRTNAINHGFRLFTSNGKSPKNLLVTIVKMNPKSNVRTGVHVYDHPQRISDGAKLEKLEALLDQFLAASSGTPGFSKGLRTPTKNSFFRAIERRILAFDTAIRLHSLNPP